MKIEACIVEDLLKEFMYLGQEYEDDNDRIEAEMRALVTNKGERKDEELFPLMSSLAFKIRSEADAIMAREVGLFFHAHKDLDEEEVATLMLLDDCDLIRKYGRNILKHCKEEGYVGYWEGFKKTVEI